MHFLAQLLVAVVAIAHVGFLVLEMFFWQRPLGRRIFNTTIEFASQSSTLAANQGLYNGFLAAGLIWSLMPVGAVGSAKALATFFLACVVIAGEFMAQSPSANAF